MIGFVKNPYQHYVYVHDVYETYEKAIKSLYDQKSKNVYISKFELKNSFSTQIYIPNRVYYVIRDLTAMFDSSIHNHYFLCQYDNTHAIHNHLCQYDNTHDWDFTNEDREDPSLFSHVIPNLDESNESLQSRISDYYTDVKRGDQYYAKIVSELNIEEDNEFKELIKKRYGDHSDEILTFLSKYKHINTIHTDYQVRKEIKERCKKLTG
jgi:hypothetical protein